MVICFGQQPCGFFPKRFLYAKIVTARRLQAELGGEIVFFFHDSDHDHRETVTAMRDRQTGVLERINFDTPNSLQKRFSPLYAKDICDGWVEKTARRLPRFVDDRLVDIFASVQARKVADFCLKVYEKCGLLEQVRVVRSSDPEIRRRAPEVDDFYVDLPYQGETVRARRHKAGFRLHRGGDEFIELPDQPFSKSQVSPTRDTRLRWMQAVVGCSHYVSGASEQNYLKTEATPEITFVPRDPIDEAHLAYLPDV